MASVGPCSGYEQQNGTVLVVPSWFRADLGTNLIKQGENVTGRCSVVECSCGKRETLGLSPGQAKFFSAFVT